MLVLVTVLVCVCVCGSGNNCGGSGRVFVMVVVTVGVLLFTLARIAAWGDEGRMMSGMKKSLQGTAKT